MPIRQPTIKRHGKNFILLDSATTVKIAFQKLKTKAYQANETYLIFSQDKGQFRVALFSDIEQAKALGVTDETPLSALSFIIPPPTRVEVQETGKYGEVRDWLATHPQSTVLVVNKEGVVQGILDNPNRGGGSSWLHQLAGTPRHLPPGQLLRCPKCGYEYELRYFGEWPIFCPTHNNTQLEPQAD